MTIAAEEPMLRQIGRLFGAGGTVAGLDAAALLDRFVRTRDDAAFEALVRRHGPMVLAVCRRTVPDLHTAEDAFQATFLVLARRAQSIKDPNRLGPWLYGVARRVALRARADLIRRRSRERGGEAVSSHEFERRTPSLTDSMGFDLDDALESLPRAYRDVVVLCDLEGLSHEEAARQLGWPLGTVKGRHHRARGRLRDRLSARGACLSMAAIGGLLAHEGRAAVSDALLHETVRAATGIAAGGAIAAAGSVSASAVTLADGVLRTMFWTKLRSVAVVGVSGLILVGGGAAARQFGGQAAPSPRPSEVSVPKVEVAPTPSQLPSPSPVANAFPAPSRSPVDDAISTPSVESLPSISPSPSVPAEFQELARLSQEKLNFTRQAYERALANYMGATPDTNGLRARVLSEWENRWREALKSPGLTNEDQVKALRGHLSWLEDYEAQWASNMKGMFERGVLMNSRNRAASGFGGEPQEAGSKDGEPKLTPEKLNELLEEQKKIHPTYELVRYYQLDTQLRLAELEAQRTPTIPATAPLPQTGPMLAPPPGAILTPATSLPVHPNPELEIQPLSAPPQELPVATNLPLTSPGPGVLDAVADEVLDAPTEPSLAPPQNLPVADSLPPTSPGPDSLPPTAPPSEMPLDSATVSEPGAMPPPMPTYEAPRFEAVTSILDQPVDLDLKPGTTLGDALKTIRKLSARPGQPEGGSSNALQIYVDPVGLQMADVNLSKELNAPFSLKDVPLRTSLECLLRQFKLVYIVRNGLVEVTSPAVILNAGQVPYGGAGNIAATIPGYGFSIAPGQTSLSSTNPRNQLVQKALDQPISVTVQEAPLHDFLEAVRKQIEEKTPTKSLQFYLDPGGLEFTQSTPESPISIELSGVPAETILALGLRQRGLMFGVVDGVVVVGSANDPGFRGWLNGNPTAFGTGFGGMGGMGGFQ